MSRFPYRSNIEVIDDYELKKLIESQDYNSITSSSPFLLIGNEKEIVDRIRKKTDESNLNNITRTKAYFQFFSRHPEVHWSFLAHMVSRNAGWNMTDLKGGLVGEILPDSKKNNFFQFLERANALIFQDAYPQLLLYEESKQTQKELFHLLKAFHVSRFMIPIWHHFFQNQNSRLLTIALIINEQNYIQERVINHSNYHNTIHSLEFKLQDLFGFTQIIFPYLIKKWCKQKHYLAGRTVQNFTSLVERIQFGKSLYSILFLNNKVFEGAKRFSSSVSHTGSRSDYWKSIFTPKEESFSKKIYSPRLEQAWPNIHHRFDDFSDWYQDSSIFSELKTLSVIKETDITKEYIKDLITLYSIENVKSLL